MANQAKNNRGGWNKVVEWYARNAYAVQMIYSLGASVVIVGALFKILHWPGASYVLMVGMFTEAFLFAIGIFEKPHTTYHWENVFPQLLGDETKELLGGSGIAADGLVGGNSQQAASQSEMPAVMGEKEVAALKEGIENLTKTAGQLSELSTVAAAGNALAKNMTDAANTVGQFAQSQTALSTNTKTLSDAYQTIGADVQAMTATSKEYAANVTAAKDQAAALNAAYAQHVKNLNAAYELQLKNIQQQADAYATMAADSSKLSQSLSEGLKASQDFTASAQKLSQQVADLNKVYGNMLNALA